MGSEMCIRDRFECYLNRTGGLSEIGCIFLRSAAAFFGSNGTLPATTTSPLVNVVSRGAPSRPRL